QKFESLIFKPTYNPDNDTFECKKGIYYEETSHTTIISQISGFGNIAGLIFNIAFYGVTSRLKFRTTCIVDDILILTCLLTPMFSWFFTAKVALIFFQAEVKQYGWVVFDLEGLSFLTDIAYLVLSNTLLIPYIIPQKNHKSKLKILEIWKTCENTNLDMYKFVFLHINDYEKVSKFLGHQRLYLEIEKNNEEALEYAKKLKDFYVNKEYDEVINFYFEQLSNEKKLLVAKKGEKVSKKDLSIADKIIFEKFQRPIGKRVLKEKLKNLLSMQEFTQIFLKWAYFNISLIHIGQEKIVWIVIPEPMESYANEKDYYIKLDTEIEYCKKIEDMLNSEPDEEVEIPNDRFADD
ncbi:18802_t:CDS:2, partial [Gigaspora rosea]